MKRSKEGCKDGKMEERKKGSMEGGRKDERRVTQQLFYQYLYFRECDKVTRFITMPLLIQTSHNTICFLKILILQNCIVVISLEANCSTLKCNRVTNSLCHVTYLSDRGNHVANGLFSICIHNCEGLTKITEYLTESQKIKIKLCRIQLQIQTTLCTLEK